MAPPTSSPSPPTPPSSRLHALLEPESKSRRVALAVAVWVVCTVVFAVIAGRERLADHTPFNHFALLADAWLHGRQDLANGAPGYTQNNDFAQFDGKTYISFPPFPAVLMLPFVKLAGSAEAFQDGQFILWLAGVGPAVLFLVLEKLRRGGRSSRTEMQNVFLALLFAFGTVYFFTAVQGTVWFAAHVVGVGVLALYILFALDAERPLLAGLLLGCAWTTRAPMMFAATLFAFEAFRVSCKEGLPAEIEAETRRTFRERVLIAWAGVDKPLLFRRYALFAAPLLVSVALASWTNFSRFHELSPLAFGHEFLGVVWKGRIDRWGLASVHYLPKNLGAALTILPWMPPKGLYCNEIPGVRSLPTALANFTSCVPFRINVHGLALWFTTPIYFWLVRPRRNGFLYGAVLVTALIPIAIDLLYQNSGWQQFGYRFSNDYALFLFVLLALGDRPFGALFKLAAAWSVVWALFGAVTFDRAKFDKFYYRDGTQTILYQPD